ncbi:hypothetical protein [Candidatus Parabeggiatoa sp. HSG14]|uniref:hypothetical protein n=1 Tax=Candidatus Parabeggiatoa sp. HSG14 TaxID=3055593 RepID=UPI0025A6D638|nr:hypothetical protein [Thiotrichales bacterium HSG14]
MKKVLRYVLQIFNYSILMIVVWYFSAAPAYHPLEPNQASIVLAFGHVGQLVGECRQRTPEELAKLAPNMRNPMVCPRQRSPLNIELLMDEKLLFREVFHPPGLSGDWGVDVYRQFTVPSGSHHLTVRMKDSVRVDDFNHVHKENITLKPSQLLTIDFQPKEGGFIIN